MSSSHFSFFQALTPEMASMHLRKLPLRDLIKVWMTGSCIRPLINADVALLKRLGVSSFEAFLDRKNALLETIEQPLEKLQKLQDMVLDEELPLNTAEFLAQDSEANFKSFFSDEDIHQLFYSYYNSIRARGGFPLDQYGFKTNLILQIHRGKWNGICAALFEGFITKDEYLAIPPQILTLGFDPSHNKTLTEVVCRGMLFEVGGINAVNAFRAGLVPMTELTTMNSPPPFPWIQRWFAGGNLATFRLRAEFLSRWEETNAVSREALTKRLEALYGIMPLMVVNKLMTLESAESATQILRSSRSKIRQFNLNSEDLKILDEDYSTPFYSEASTYEELMNLLLTLGAKEFLYILLLEKLITVVDIKSFFDSFDGRPEYEIIPRLLASLAAPLIGLTAFREGLFSISDFHCGGTFARLEKKECDRLISNNCKLLRADHEFLKANWESQGAASFEAFRKEFYALPTAELRKQVFKGEKTLADTMRTKTSFTGPK